MKARIAVQTKESSRTRFDSGSGWGWISIAVCAAVWAVAASGAAASPALKKVSGGENHVGSIEVIVFRIQLR